MRNGPADPNCSGSEVGEIKQREVVRLLTAQPAGKCKIESCARVHLV